MIISILKLKKVTTKGSITVEAAFVMPIVIFTIIALILLSFYLHDTCRVQGIVDKTLNKAGMCVKHEADFASGDIFYERMNDRGVFYLLFGSTEKEKEQMEEYLVKELSEGLFLSHIKAITVDVEKTKIILAVDMDTNITLPFFTSLFQQNKYTQIKGEYPVHDPAEKIRRTEVILDTGSSIKGVDKLKEKFEKIFGSK